LNVHIDFFFLVKFSGHTIGQNFSLMTNFVISDLRTISVKQFTFIVHITLVILLHISNRHSVLQLYTFFPIYAS